MGIPLRFTASPGGGAATEMMIRSSLLSSAAMERAALASRSAWPADLAMAAASWNAAQALAVFPSCVRHSPRL